MYKDPLTQADMAYNRYKKLNPTEEESDLPKDDSENVGTVTSQNLSQHADTSEQDNTRSEPASSALSENVQDSGLVQDNPRGPGSPSPERVDD